ncbi:MAG: hypothetical protein AB7V36_00960 [Bacteroidales bacterium]|nr:hypothetical protein [Sphingobacteriia bacterium]
MKIIIEPEILQNKKLPDHGVFQTRPISVKATIIKILTRIQQYKVMARAKEKSSDTVLRFS